MKAYVYRHIRHDKNEPFYIGIGRTPYRHSTKQNRNPIWDRIILKTTYDVEILFDGVTWEFACKKEIELIKLYGRINRGTGTLSNMTDGGDGNLGIKHTPEAIRKISEASKGRPGHWKGKKQSEEFKKKLSESKKGKPIPHLMGKPIPEKTKEAVRKHSYGNKYHLGKPHSEESKKKMGDSKRGKPSPMRGKKWPSHIPHTCIGRKYSQETILKMQRSQKSRPVLKCSLSGQIIEEYYSGAEAARRNNIHAAGIHGVCRSIERGINRTYKGFVWKFK